MRRERVGVFYRAYPRATQVYFMREDPGALSPELGEGRSTKASCSGTGTKT